MKTSEPTNNKKVKKDVLSKQLYQGGSFVSRYKEKVIGKNISYLRLVQYEVSQLISSNLGGGIGYFLRKLLMASSFNRFGKSVILGKGITLRIPGNITIGDNVAIDDYTLLDGGTNEDCRIEIGDQAVISKSCVIQSKTGPLVIGRESDIGPHVILTSISSILIEPNVLIAGNCYIGGARYKLEDKETPIMYQDIYSRGPVIIGSGTWLGASVTILDGVKIGRGSVIGAGSVVTKDIPNYSIACGTPAQVIGKRA